MSDRRALGSALAIALLLTACTATPAARSRAGLSRTASPDAGPGATATQQVLATERAFANSMADRDFGAFTALLATEAIFFNGNTVMHGAAEVAAAWQPYFKGPTAPFAWQPDHVEVLPSGTLALSTGPVYVSGQVVGRFNSIWRLEPAGGWHIVFDKGEAVCAASPPGQPDFSRLSPGNP
jgi:ketosteroid isomerase-like protein